MPERARWRPSGRVHYHTHPRTKEWAWPLQHHRLIIVGSGPAGYTAAVYAARAALTPVIITGVEVGGQMTTTTEVDNWPGDDQGVMGPELMERMKRHAERFGTKLIHNHVDRVELGSHARFACSAARTNTPATR